MDKEFYIYIVECNDKSYYCGVTNSVEKRIWEHNNDLDDKHYTFKRRPVILKYVESYKDVNDAITREKQLKRWSRKKKEALIMHNHKDLPEIARGKKGYLNRKFFK